jgi:hypothetical protein
MPPPPCCSGRLDWNPTTWLAVYLKCVNKAASEVQILAGKRWAGALLRRPELGIVQPLAGEVVHAGYSEFMRVKDDLKGGGG